MTRSADCTSEVPSGPARGRRSSNAWAKPRSGARSKHEDQLKKLKKKKNRYLLVEVEEALRAVYVVKRGEREDFPVNCHGVDAQLPSGSQKDPLRIRPANKHTVIA